MLGCPKGIFSQKEKPYTARTCREQIENRDNEFVFNENSDEELIESSPLLHPESGKHLTLSYDGSQASEEYNSDCFFESIDLSPLQPLAFVISIGLWRMYQGIKAIFSCIGTR